MTLRRSFQVVVIGLALVSCEQQRIDTATSTVEQYLNLPKPPYKYFSDQFSDLQIQLGRVLFYDPALSANNTISCASCHKQAYAFGDNVALSKGFEGGLTLRNTIPLVDSHQFAVAKAEPNANRHPGGLFWDGRRASMTEAVMEPIFHPIEMGLEWLVLQEKLESLPYYAPLFNNAYLRPDITYTGVQQALAAFVSVMQSKQSKIDQHALNLEEKKGAGLFATKYECAACHQGSVDVQGTFNYPSDPVFRITEFANIGLQETYEDNGLSLITQAETDEGRFRVPSLSNVALTAPYMHDGSITSLEDVIEHYSGGIMSHHNLDARLLEADRTPLQMTISADEKKALVAFLKAFTDEDVATNPRLTDPFKSSEN